MTTALYPYMHRLSDTPCHPSAPLQPHGWKNNSTRLEWDTQHTHSSPLRCAEVQKAAALSPMRVCSDGMLELMCSFSLPSDSSLCTFEQVVSKEKERWNPSTLWTLLHPGGRAISQVGVQMDFWASLRSGYCTSRWPWPKSLRLTTPHKRKKSSGHEDGQDPQGHSQGHGVCALATLKTGCGERKSPFPDFDWHNSHHPSWWSQDKGHSRKALLSLHLGTTNVPTESNLSPTPRVNKQWKKGYAFHVGSYPNTFNHLNLNGSSVLVFWPYPGPWSLKAAIPSLVSVPPSFSRELTLWHIEWSLEICLVPDLLV